MKFKIMLALSLLLNLAAICYLYTINALDSLAADTDTGSATSVADLSGDVTTQTDVDPAIQPYQHSDVKHLQKIGLNDEQARMLILQELRVQSGARSRLFNDQYWQARSADGMARQIEAKIEAERTLRNTLVNVFGDHAHKLVDLSFTPLVSHSFLSPRDQIALREYQLRAQKEAVADQLASSVDELVGAGVLTESGALEYRLRYSSLATRLLNSGVKFTEQSFRDSYMALAPIYDSQQGSTFDANSLMAQRNKLKQLMGDDHALRILANLDNRYAQLKAAGERYYLNEEQILSAYKIISDGEEKMIEGYFVRKSNPQQGIQMIREAALFREQKLAEYLGEDISRSLLRAFTSARPDPTTPAGILLSGY